MGLIAILSGPVIFMGIGVVIATGWAIFMCAVVGIPTEVRFTGPVMVTGCCRLTGDVMLTVLVAVLIWAVMVTALLELTLRFTAEVLAAELVTGVIAAELLCKLLASLWELSIRTWKELFKISPTVNSPFRGPEWFHCQSLMPIQKYRHILGYINKGSTAIILGVNLIN